MLGTTFTITLGGSGGTAKVLPLINQDGYSSEYYLDEALCWYRVKVRHLTESVKTGSQPFTRHIVTMQRFLKPTETVPDGRLFEVIFTIRADPSDVAADIVGVTDAMAFNWVHGNGFATKILGWES